jgi:hypothetical protein
LFAPSECVYEIASMKALHRASGTPSRPMHKSIASPLTSRWLILGGAVSALALAGTLSMWAHFGTVVFFETIRTGFVACFG